MCEGIMSWGSAHPPLPRFTVWRIENSRCGVTWTTTGYGKWKSERPSNMLHEAHPSDD